MIRATPRTGYRPHPRDAIAVRTGAESGAVRTGALAEPGWMFPALFGAFGAVLGLMTFKANHPAGLLYWVGGGVLAGVALHVSNANA